MYHFRRAGLSFAAIAALIGAFGSPARAATYKITWLLGHKNLDYFEEAAVSFKTAVEKGSRGDIAVTIRELQDDETAKVPIAAQVAKGEAEMGHSFTDVMGALDPRMHVFEAPFVMRNYRHMEGVVEGPVGTEMLAGLRDHGIVGLSFTYSGGASGVATLGRELRGPEDLKGLKVGVFGDAVNSAWLEALGATPVPIGHDLTKILPLERDHRLDAVVTTWRNFDRESLGSEFRDVGMMGSTYLVSVTYVNAKFFDALPPKYRELISKASREAGRIERARTIQLNESARRGMTEDRGVRATYLSAEGQSRFVAALRPAFEGSIEKIVGKDFVERVKSTPDAPSIPQVPIDYAVVYQYGEYAPDAP
jgi:TRAP-type C4-dicarboxylate transport system substrate-binding protein